MSITSACDMDWTWREITHLIFATVLLGAIFIIAYQWPLSMAIMIGAIALTIHEVGHKVVGRLRCVDDVHFTLMPLGISVGFVSSLVIGHAVAAPGGVTVGDTASEKDRLLMALGGPFANFLMFVVFWGIHVFHASLGLPQHITLDASHVLGGGSFEVHIWGAIALMNLFLGVFNMVPVPGFDGSHVFKMSPGIWFAVFGGSVVTLGLVWGDLVSIVSPLFENTFPGIVSTMIHWDGVQYLLPVFPGLMIMHLTSSGLPDWISTTLSDTEYEVIE